MSEPVFGALFASRTIPLPRALDLDLSTARVAGAMRERRSAQAKRRRSINSPPRRFEMCGYLGFRNSLRSGRKHTERRHRASQLRRFCAIGPELVGRDLCSEPGSRALSTVHADLHVTRPHLKRHVELAA